MNHGNAADSILLGPATGAEAGRVANATRQLQQTAATRAASTALEVLA